LTVDRLAKYEIRNSKFDERRSRFPFIEAADGKEIMEMPR